MRREAAAFVAGLVLGLAVAALAVVIYLESRPEPVFACPKGLGIVIEDRVLLHKPGMPASCGLVPAP